MMCSMFFFKQKTAYEMRISDWSSDVCSSDLPTRAHRRICRLLSRAIWLRRARRRFDPGYAGGLSRTRPRLHALAREILSGEGGRSEGKSLLSAEEDLGEMPVETICVRIPVWVKLRGTSGSALYSRAEVGGGE